LCLVALWGFWGMLFVSDIMWVCVCVSYV
jgi:hypothetical protein